MAQQPCHLGWGRHGLYSTLAGYNLDRPVEAGGRGGGTPVPGSSQPGSINIFLPLRLCGGRQHGGRACGAVDTTMVTVGAVLDGGLQLLGHTPHTLPITSGRRAAVEGRKGPG